MTAYADTSALVKLFVTEAGSDATRRLLTQAGLVATSLVARTELGAALARGARRGHLSKKAAGAARQRLEEVWPTWVRIAVDEELVRQGEALAWEHGLRGYDAVHLAAALAWQRAIARPVVLATFDRELWDAAGPAGLVAWPDERP